ncbi:Proton-conducting membrane transporter [Ferrimonas sediminum]|uniref:Proton-conducting membrane transporter n=1 Tax=Ferrimonas sediminum TaxID=718193 RepID=A0A1G8RGK7_9GAMM|nr:proton-conducting transporter membrane subunit [Ferrimonas sediminum]SDJ16234.1 Proton-conducting membrane transporter [Ferrimonas sediminum]
MSEILLLFSPLWPLVLALPNLHRRLPWPAHMALLPAAVLLFVPQEVAIELPWLYSGAGMGVDSHSRWWLAVSVVFWGIAATLRDKADGGTNSLFLLSMSGQLGAVLATDMVVFLSSSTLMGYASIGLLCADSDVAARRAGRLYLVALVIADLVLFEAMLLAAELTGSVGFASLPLVVSWPNISALYLVLVIIGFALKVGVWPIHQWLTLAYHPGRLARSLLLWLGPVGTGLLGAAQWLPPGKVAAPWLGTGLQALGAASVLYCLVVVGSGAQRQRQPAYVVIMVTGGLVMALGTALVTPEGWSRSGGALSMVVALGIGAALGGAGLQRHRGQVPVVRAKPEVLAVERWCQAFIEWGRRVGTDPVPGVRAWWITWWREHWRLSQWVRVFEAGEQVLRRWRLALSLLLGLCILAVSVALWLLQVGLTGGAG